MGPRDGVERWADSRVLVAMTRTSLVWLFLVPLAACSLGHASSSSQTSADDATPAPDEPAAGRSSDAKRSVPAALGAEEAREQRDPPPNAKVDGRPRDARVVAAKPPPRRGDADEDPRVRDAKNVLATHLSVSPADLTVVTFEEGSWGSSAIGCPKPGYKYLTRPVKGYRVVLRAGSKKHHLHGTRGSGPRLCASPRPGYLHIE